MDASSVAFYVGVEAVYANFYSYLNSSGEEAASYEYGAGATFGMEISIAIYTSHFFKDLRFILEGECIFSLAGSKRHCGGLGGIKYFMPKF